MFERRHVRDESDHPRRRPADDRSRYARGPGGRRPARSLDDWLAQFSAQGLATAVEPDGPGAAWIVVATLRCRGYALRAGATLEGINFELTAPDPAPATAAIEAAADALGWEVHPDGPDEPEDDDVEQD